MKLAIIDIGSNSIRLLLGTYIDGQWHNEPKKLWTTRLGKRNLDGTLSEESMENSYKALEEIYAESIAYGATAVYAFATSAVREAPNGGDFIEKAKAIGSIVFTILAGEEEAQWGFKGALSDQLQNGRHYTTIDIGGGSTEIALGSKEGIYWNHSYPVGAVRLQDMSEEGPQRIWEETRYLWNLMPIKGDFGDFYAIGGTATTLGAIDLGLVDYDGEAVQNHKMSRECIEGLVMDLRHKSREERLAVPGLPPGRVDIIVSGGEILTSIMDAYEVPHIYISDKDGMEGLQEWCRTEKK